MFERLKSMFTGHKVEAATQLSPVAPIKAKPGNRAWPAFFQSTKPAEGILSRPERRLVNSDVTNLRNGNTTHKVISDLVISSPELSNAVYTAVRIGVPEKYVAVARDMDGTLNPDATRLLQSLLTRFDVIGRPEEGYVGHGSIKSVSESLARDMTIYGMMAAELVLDKSRMPYRIAPISATVIQFRPDGDGVRPIQKVGDLEIDLDTPTITITQLDSNLLDPYPISPLEPALKAVIFSETFMADLTRVMRRAIHPRLKVSIDEDKFRKSLSAEASMDENVARTEMANLISEIETKVNGLNPEDALIYFDSLGFDVETPTGSGQDYTVLREIANAKLASGSKTLPSVLGLAAGSASSNIASTEVALYLRSVDSSVRQKLNETYSRLLTVAVRLMGLDCYCTFEYEALSIRPAAELEAFTQTRQMRILEQLDLGFITDEEASLQLTGKLPPAGFKPLSGTRFKTPAPAVNPIESDPAANPSNDGSTLNQKTKSDQPAVGRGQNKKADTDTQEIEAQAPTFITPNITMNIDNTQQGASVLKMKRDEDGNLTIERIADVG